MRDARAGIRAIEPDEAFVVNYENTVLDLEVLCPCAVVAYVTVRMGSSVRLRCGHEYFVPAYIALTRKGRILKAVP